jgi:hypothetical protein
MNLNTYTLTLSPVIFEHLQEAKTRKIRKKLRTARNYKGRKPCNYRAFQEMVINSNKC